MACGCLRIDPPAALPARMLFNSLTFVVFFVLVLSAYWTMKSWPARKNLLLVASYIF